MLLYCAFEATPGNIRGNLFWIFRQNRNVVICLLEINGYIRSAKIPNLMALAIYRAWNAEVQRSSKTFYDFRSMEIVMKEKKVSSSDPINPWSTDYLYIFYTFFNLLKRLRGILIYPRHESKTHRKIDREKKKKKKRVQEHWWVFRVAEPRAEFVAAHTRISGGIAKKEGKSGERGTPLPAAVTRGEASIYLLLFGVSLSLSSSLRMASSIFPCAPTAVCPTLFPADLSSRTFPSFSPRRMWRCSRSSLLFAAYNISNCFFAFYIIFILYIFFKQNVVTHRFQHLQRNVTVLYKKKSFPTSYVNNAKDEN